MLDKCLRGSKIALVQHSCLASLSNCAEGVQFYFPSCTYAAIPYCNIFPFLDHYVFLKMVQYLYQGRTLARVGDHCCPLPRQLKNLIIYIKVSQKVFFVRVCYGYTPILKILPPSLIFLYSQGKKAITEKLYLLSLLHVKK